MKERLYSVWHDISLSREELTGDFDGIHVHNSHELILTKQGTLDVTVNGKKYSVGPKNLILMNNLEMHLLTPINYPYERYGMHITASALSKVPLNITYFSIIANHPGHFNNVFDVSGFFDEIEEIFKSMEDEVGNEGTEGSGFRDEYSEEMIRLKLGELLVLLKRHFPERFTVHKSPSDCSILSIQQYIDTNFQKDISINELAREAYISHTSFINSFKKLTGYSPKHYLLMCRLAEAKAFLSNTSYSISEIAMKVGFKDSNSFIRFFRQELGLTPGEYRKIENSLSQRQERL